MGATFVIGSLSQAVPALFVSNLPSYMFFDDNVLLPWACWGCGCLVGSGVLVGIAQGLILARLGHRDRSFAWAATTAAGTVPALLISVAVNQGIVGTLSLLFSGGLLGFAQWFVLRRYVQRAAWWIVANAAAWLAAGLLFAGVYYVVLGGPGSDLAIYPLVAALRLSVDWMTAVCLFAVLTGLVLVRLLHHVQPPSELASLPSTTDEPSLFRWEG